MRIQRLLVWGILIVAVVSLGVLLFGPGPASGDVGNNKVLVVRLYGAIEESGMGILGGGSITPEFVARQLARAEADPRVQAVVLRVSSPGGSIAASQEIYSLIARFPKPVVVSMGDQAASGGYYISAAADAIVANPGTITGSIGVISAVTNLEGLYEKLGIEVEIIKTGEHKDMLQRALTDEERQLLQDLSDEAWRQFVEAVAEGRGLDVAHVEQLATGEVFTGSQALELGLVDRLGDLDAAVQLAGELAGIDDPVPVEIESPTLWQQLLGSVVSIARSARTHELADLFETIEGLKAAPPLRY